MSPEQLEGKKADARSDVWALGCVLYEMATGKRAFEGKSQASLITSIMGSEPAPISQISPMTPPALDTLVQGMLAKDPQDRVQSAHDVKLQLKWVAEGGSEAGVPKPIARKRRTRERFLWSIVASLAISSALLAVNYFKAKLDAPRPVTRTSSSAPPPRRLRSRGRFGPPAISPDGTAVFDAVGGGGGAPVAPAHRRSDLGRSPAPTAPVIHSGRRTNRSIGFFTFDKLRRLDLATGSVVTLVGGIESARGGSWSKDGVIIYTPTYSSGLFRVADSGGTPQAVTTLDTTVTTTNRFPQFLPDGKHFIYLGASHLPAGPASAIYCASLDGGKPAKVLESKSSAVYANGFLLFVRDSTLMAQEFDAGSRTTRGELRATHEAMQLDGSTWNSPVA
jgi:hypothetical protein